MPKCRDGSSFTHLAYPVDSDVWITSPCLVELNTSASVGKTGGVDINKCTFFLADMLKRYLTEYEAGYPPA